MSEPIAVTKQSPERPRVTYEQLLDTELHECFELGYSDNVARVPGGWIYSGWDSEGRIACTFVPMCADDFGRTTGADPDP